MEPDSALNTTGASGAKSGKPARRSPALTPLPDRLVKVRELCFFFGVSRHELWEMRRENLIPAPIVVAGTLQPTRTGRPKLRWWLSEVLAYARSRPRCGQLPALDFPANPSPRRRAVGASGARSIARRHAG